jgi:hypothetical protein
MRSYDQNNEYDRAELDSLNAEKWMVDCLALNPRYVFWGPGEDYMSTRDQGWGTSKVMQTWKEFGPIELDDLNECVDFYFHINRAEVACKACGRSGYNPETNRIAENFYSSATGARWCDDITQDEVDALIEHNRLWDFWRTCGPNGWEDIVPRPTVTAEMVNLANGAKPKQPGVWMPNEHPIVMAGGTRAVEPLKHSPFMHHDAIHRMILIETRARRLGVWGLCERCRGRCSVFTEPAAKLGLTLWILHPRKGCSRGIRIEEISKEELPAAKAWLAQAAKRNAERFAGVVASV